MPIFELTENELRKIEETSFSAVGTRERADLQRILQNQIEIIAPNILVIAEEFDDWDDSHRRIDLLGVDKDANLVVFELKRTESGGHMELQALRYAAMVSTMTFDKAVEVYSDYLKKKSGDDDAQKNLLDFLSWETKDDDLFNQDVRVILVSAEFSMEITTTVLWLNDYGLDIRCIRIKPYKDGKRTLVDIKQVIPLPEAGDYTINIGKKNRQERMSRNAAKDTTKFDVEIFGKKYVRQARRNAIFFVVKSLCDSGVAPEKISEIIYWKQLYLQIDENVNADDFIRAATLQREANGKLFQKRRWFCEENELIHFEEKTYAFTNRWGSKWGSAMNLLKNAFPEARMDFWTSEEKTDERDISR